MDPVPYRLTYSGRVTEEFEALARRASELGIAPEVAAAARDLERRLMIYPQFGEPIRDLPSLDASATEWFGFVDPLSVRYVLIEERRKVLVVAPLTLSGEPRRPPP